MTTFSWPCAALQCAQRVSQGRERVPRTATIATRAETPGKSLPASSRVGFPGVGSSGVRQRGGSGPTCRRRRAAGPVRRPNGCSLCRSVTARRGVAGATRFYRCAGADCWCDSPSGRGHCAHRAVVQVIMRASRAAAVLAVAAGVDNGPGLCRARCVMRPWRCSVLIAIMMLERRVRCAGQRRAMPGVHQAQRARHRGCKREPQHRRQREPGEPAQGLASQCHGIKSTRVGRGRCSGLHTARESSVKSRSSSPAPARRAEPAGCRAPSGRPAPAGRRRASTRRWWRRSRQGSARAL